LNPDTGRKIFQIWESHSYSYSGNHRCNRNSAMFLLKKCLIWKPTQTPATAKNEKWLWMRIFTNFWLRVWKKNAGSCRSQLRIFGIQPSATLKNWVIGFVFSITARSASALAVAFYRLLEPLSQVRFVILKLMQLSLPSIHRYRYPDYLERKQVTREAHFANW